MLANAPVRPVLLVMRVSALYLRNKWILSFLAVEAVAAMSVGCVSTVLL